MSDIREDIADFRKRVVCRLQATGVKDEILGFELREGVTFPGVEAFLGNRVLNLNLERIRYNKEHGKLDDFADYVARTLRSKPVIPQPANLYRVQDLLREQYFFLADILRGAFGHEETNIALQRFDEAFETQTAGRKVSEAAKYRFLRDSIARHITAYLAAAEVSRTTRRTR